MLPARGEISAPDAPPWMVDVIRERLKDYIQLLKARLSTMVLVSGLVGYWLAVGQIDLAHLLWFTLGTFFVVGGANALNQVLERNSDARMTRTSHRPLPQGRITAGEATFVASALTLVGLGILFVKSSVLTGVLALVGTVTYVFVYTPMKSRSAWSTVPGALAGSMPPLMGWTAASTELGPMALCLFGVLFLWQFPHTWAIAATYREDYAKVGYRAMPVEGTRARTVLATALLVAVSLVPARLGLVGTTYVAGAALLGAVVLLAALRFGDGTSKRKAGELLAASLFYLPLILALLAVDGKVV